MKGEKQKLKIQTFEVKFMVKERSQLWQKRVNRTREREGGKEAKGSCYKDSSFRGGIATCTSYNLQRVERKASSWLFLFFDLLLKVVDLCIFCEVHVFLVIYLTNNGLFDT